MVGARAIWGPGNRQWGPSRYAVQRHHLRTPRLCGEAEHKAGRLRETLFELLELFVNQLNTLFAIGAGPCKGCKPYARCVTPKSPQARSMLPSPNQCLAPEHWVANASNILCNLSSLLRFFMMAAFYHDSSRKSVFADLARQYSPISGPEMCQIDLLEWSPGIAVSPCHEVGVGKMRSIPYAHVRLREYYYNTAVNQDQCPGSTFQSSATRADCVRSALPVRYAADDIPLQALRL